MSRRLVFVIMAGLALSGCAGSGLYIQPPTNALANWDGLGPLPKRNHVKRVKARKTSDAVASNDSSPSEDELSIQRPPYRVAHRADQAESGANGRALGMMLS